uniref:ShKT domain-containing protein n=1 Tax=Pseudictyota dubia TaxID=2749911 RepID=A0A7R9W4A1_9STRA
MNLRFVAFLALISAAVPLYAESISDSEDLDLLGRTSEDHYLRQLGGCKGNNDKKAGDCKRECDEVLGWSNCQYGGNCNPVWVEHCDFKKKYRCNSNKKCRRVKQECRDDCHEHFIYCGGDYDDMATECKRECSEKLKWDNCNNGKCDPAKVKYCGFDWEYWCYDQKDCIYWKETCRNDCHNYFL